ncbi:hypothetical protein GUJ93_ZPchr0009g2415 [Zizania palustris]|uniref:Uncharacterized protein n=1 Tax=Zizania palustris TaxID=103762 RepID=A0A8J5RLY5_ZIZPA|nr:hypothetical protein GUJ93_ZPchr0009g2415 [Zizania palustris]
MDARLKRMDEESQQRKEVWKNIPLKIFAAKKMEETNVEKKGEDVLDVAPEMPRQHTIEVENAPPLNVTNDSDHCKLVLDSELMALSEEVAPNVTTNSDDVNPPCVDGPLLHQIHLSTGNKPHVVASNHSRSRRRYQIRNAGATSTIYTMSCIVTHRVELPTRASHAVHRVGRARRPHALPILLHTIATSRSGRRLQIHVVVDQILVVAHISGLNVTASVTTLGACHPPHSRTASSTHHMPTIHAASLVGLHCVIHGAMLHQGATLCCTALDTRVALFAGLRRVVPLTALT